MLWQRLQRKTLNTLAETIKIADMYALGDPLQPTIRTPEATANRPNNASGSFQQRPLQDFRKRNMDFRYPNQVAAVEQNQGAAQRPRFDGPKK